MLSFHWTNHARVALFLSLLLVGGCSAASSGAGEGLADTRQRSVRIAGDDGLAYSTVLSEDRYIRRFAFEEAASEVFGHVPAAFEELELEVTVADRGSRILGVDGTRVRSIGGTRPSRYLSCGQGVGAPNADSYDVFLTLVSQVVAAEEGGSELQVHVTAYARASGVAATAVRCTSTGDLEERFFDTVQASLAG